MRVEMNSLILLFEDSGKYVSIKLCGKLEKEDYDVLVPEIEAAIKKNGKISLIIEMVDFHGWSIAALWEDTKFGVKHFNDIERLAIVGDRQWEKGMALFCKIFTTAQVRYFDLSEVDKAQNWMRKNEL